MAEPPRAPRRSLIMAGGGVKVAFQAGVLQVWLDEAGIDFFHADGASGGVFNLAMWCQGMSGTEIADNWRRYSPLRAAQPNWRGWLTLPFAESLLRYGRFRRNVLGRDWGLNWEEIRATDREATFNLYNFSRHEHVVVPASDLTEDLLISSVSLPVWFPPVIVDGDTYIDAVYATDANLIEGVRRGADELWVIWTVSERGEWRRGLLAQYFQIIEASANSRLRADLARIEENNAALAAGGSGEFGRHVDVRILRAEVPVHYLFNFTRDRMAAAVERGVGAARRWCAEQGIELAAAGPRSAPGAGGRRPAPSAGGRSVRFTESMRGHVAVGVDDPDLGARLGRERDSRLMFRLTIEIDDLDRFVADPRLEAGAGGYVLCEALGGRRPVERGVFNLFVDDADPRDKRMLYRLWFRDAAGHPLTLSGHKVVRDDPGVDLWPDTTTLRVRVLRGHVPAPADGTDDPAFADGTDDPGAAPAGAGVVAAGVVRIPLRDFARQMTTFRASAPSAVGRLAALARFGRLFVARLWDVYAGPATVRADR